jgi:nucleoside-diphosphate-sugar epimerase
VTVERLAITGASGYLGLKLAAAARQRGLGVAGVVRSDEGADAVGAVGALPVKAPNLNEEALVEAFQDAAVVVHLAGISAERGGATYEEVNLGGVQRVGRASLAAGVRRIVFLSGLGVARYGISRRSTNRYFLAKLAAEIELFRSGLETLVLRPSYVVGPGDELIPALLEEMAAGEVERIGDGGYRMQPVALGDVVDAILLATRQPLPRPHTVIELVGPEPISYAAFIQRVADVGRRLGRSAEYRVREISVADADGMAAAGGYRGLLPDELDVLLCDEVASADGLSSWLARELTGLDEMIGRAIAGSAPRAGASFRR